MATATSPSAAITKAQFDEVRSELIEQLREWYEDAADRPEATPATEGAWEHLPDIDSKSVVKASPIVERFLGIKLHVKWIRRGGYESFEDLIADLLPKLRSACPGEL